jgi:hypothetical protein
MCEEIDKYQDRTLTAHFPAITVPTAASLVCKGPPEEMNSSQSTMSSSITSTPRRSPSFVSLSKPKMLALDKGQLTLFGNAILINANNACHIAIADFIHSNALPFSLSECPKLLKIIEGSRNLGPGYIPPDCQSVSGNLLNSLFNTGFADVMKTLLLEAHIFWNIYFW